MQHLPSMPILPVPPILLYYNPCCCTLTAQLYRGSAPQHSPIPAAAKRTHCYRPCNCAPTAAVDAADAWLPALCLLLVAGPALVASANSSLELAAAAADAEPAAALLVPFTSTAASATPALSALPATAAAELPPGDGSTLPLLLGVALRLPAAGAVSLMLGKRLKSLR
jgi:hypothetical protein